MKLPQAMCGFSTEVICLYFNHSRFPETCFVIDQYIGLFLYWGRGQCIGLALSYVRCKYRLVKIIHVSSISSGDML